MPANFLQPNSDAELIQQSRDGDESAYGHGDDSHNIDGHHLETSLRKVGLINCSGDRSKLPKAFGR